MKPRFTIKESLFSGLVAGYLTHGTASSNPLKKYVVELTTSEGKKFSQVFIGRCSLKNKPLIVWFHGWIDNELSYYDLSVENQDEFNILFPQDRAGHLRAGSWWLGGSDSDTWVYPVCTKYFVSYLQANIYCGPLIFAGSSMGGFGTLMNSCFYNGVYCFVSVPQTHLDPKGSYFKDRNQNFLKKLGIDKDNFKMLTDSISLLDLTKDSQVMSFKAGGISLPCTHIPRFVHITATSWDSQDSGCSYLSDYILPYIRRLHKMSVPISTSIMPVSGHDLFFYPDAVAHYAQKYILSGVIDSRRSYSYQALQEQGLFTSTTTLRL